MKFVVTFLLLIARSVAEDIPYKANDEFDLKLDFQFKTRQLESNSLVYTSSQSTSKSTGPLPYLSLNFKVLKLSPEETRVRVVNNKEEIVLTKKVDTGTELHLDMGFTDDLKGHAEGYTYTIYFLNSDRKPSSRIVIYFEEDGTYRVNSEKRGKV